MSRGSFLRPFITIPGRSAADRPLSLGALLAALTHDPFALHFRLRDFRKAADLARAQAPGQGFRFQKHQKYWAHLDPNKRTHKAPKLQPSKEPNEFF